MSKPFHVDSAALPVSHTTMGEVFQVTGVDLAGPLYLKSVDKVYIVLFTYAVFWCVHLDIVTSVNTKSFLNALERFVNGLGRPTTICSDNGTKLVGAINLFNKLDWRKIEEKAGVQKIKWTFIPPSAAWWRV